MKKRIAFLLVLLTLLLCGAAALADGEEFLTIINCDRVNVRDDNGTSFARIGCYTPVTTGAVKDDMTYVTFSKAYYELYKESYTLSDYRGTYIGTVSGWVKSDCLTVVYDTRESVCTKAQDCRWELWVGGVYHKLHSLGNFTKNKNFAEHAVPTIDGKEAYPHMTETDLWTWNGASSPTVKPTYAPVVTPTPTANPSSGQFVPTGKQPTWHSDWVITKTGDNQYYVEYSEILDGKLYEIRGYTAVIPEDLNTLRWWAK